MADEEPPQLLSPELAASLGVAGGDAMLTSAKKKQKPGGGGGAKHGPRRGNASPVVTKLSKSQKRKLAKVEEDKRKREQRAGVVARLNAAKLVSDDSLTLLQGSDRMGQKMSKRETLRRELKAERAGIALPGSEHSRLLKRERPKDEQDGGEDESSGSDASDASDADDAADVETFGRKQSWPNKALMPSTAPPPKESYGPIHPLDQARLDAERIKKAEMDALAGNDLSDDDEDDADANKSAQKAASESARLASKEALAAARALAEHVRALDPEQAAERRIAALGPNAAAAAYDPKDAAAKMAAANEAAAAAAAARYPGVFVGASHCVAVTRDAEVVAAREGLPILGSEHEIVDAINSNPVVVLCGETGCGKTTQVPQFLFEAGYGDKTCLAHPGAVAVTQPRRVAVTSTATRVARELNVKLGKEVGYQVRYDKKVMTSEHGDPNQTRLKFMTDGILLREMRTDLLLRKVLGGDCRRSARARREHRHFARFAEPRGAFARGAF
jgi:ATP-dependent RNA helicase DHX37/DHR1